MHTVTHVTPAPNAAPNPSRCAGHPGEDDVGNFVLQAKGARTLRAPYICR